jgi:hypothetical protein
MTASQVGRAERGSPDMKTAMVVGILLIVLGIISLAYQGITYTTQKKVVDLGPIQATTETKERIPLPPILGGIALAGGVALVIAGSRRKA